MGALGLGHVVLVAKDRDKAARFYQEVLGSATDYIAWDQLDAIFLHCNPRHHSLALINECYGMNSGYLYHFMLETRALDDVGRAYDLVRSRKLPLVLSLGSHSNDRMTSFYMKSLPDFPWNTAGAGCSWTMPCGASSITRRPSSGATSSWACSRGETTHAHAAGQRLARRRAASGARMKPDARE